MEIIEGQVIVTLFNDEKSGFQIAKIKTEKEDITISGYFPLLSRELKYRFTGEYFNHPKYGRQFKAVSFERINDDSKEGLIAYLSSELFTGIGPVTAKKIVDNLGLDCISKILEHKDILETIGFKKNKIELLYQELLVNKIIEETVVELLKYNITPKMAMKLYHKYGNLAPKIVATNPYQLISDVEGFGFKKADSLAISLGFRLDDPLRIRSAIIYVLGLIVKNYGYTYCYKDQLIDTVIDYIKFDGITKDIILQEIEYLINNNLIVIEEDKVYLLSLYNQEIELANKIKRLSKNNVKKIDKNLFNDYLNDIKKELGISYTKTQEDAIYTALISPISIITGGPGTGKSTIINGILKMYAYLNSINYFELVSSKNVGLMAPTGRASKRMMELSKLSAMTIHRHLGYNYEGEFEFDDTNLLPYNLIIIDEASMIDIYLANNLFKAINGQSKVIIVGDLDQLPSVGPGQFLKDIIDSNIINTIKLTEIYRQSKDSNIIKLALNVKNGNLNWDIMDYYDDLSFYRESGSEIANKIVALYKELIDNGYDPLMDIEVLVPMYKGNVGIDELNLRLQALINNNEGIKYGSKEYRVGDKIIQLTNDPELKIMNGDIGIIEKIVHGEEDILIVNFDGLIVKMNKNHLENINHAYAISIHKSQGSEYNIVILAVSKSHMIMLRRKLLYTAITRAKKKLYVIGDLDAFKYGINNLDSERQTSLLNRLIDTNKIKINIEGCPFTYLGEIDMENISPYDFMDETQNTK